MKKQGRTPLILFIAASAILVQTVGVIWAEDATTIALVEHPAGEVVTDTGAKGDSVGDILGFSNDVFDKDNVKKLGRDNGWCVRTIAGKAWECSFSLMLEDGQLTVSGPYFDAADSVLAVTGGTGKYAGMHGHMKLHARNKDATEFDFVFELKE